MTENEGYNLAESAKGLGKLCPILKAKDGTIIDGFHRQNADPDWPSITVESVDSEQKVVLARLTTNFCRRKLESSEIQNSIVFLVAKRGMKVEDIAKITGISIPTIYRHLPQELKDQKKVEAGRIGGEVSAITREQTVKIQDMVTCDRCGMPTSNPETWEEHTLCPTCCGKAVIDPTAMRGYFHYKNREKTPEPLQPKTFPKETWEHRKAEMSPQHSKMEQVLQELLMQKGIKPVVTDRSFTLVSTTPDFYFPSHNLAVYIDGEEVHQNKQDRDEQLREMLGKRHGLKVLSLSYSTNSQAEVDRLLGAIVEATQ